jgi:ferritin-like metal-binding protein YciE
MIKDDTFHSLFREELQELHDAERQIIEAMPQMIRASSSEELKAALELHLQETREQLARLELIFHEMQDTPGQELCQGMRELIAEARLRIAERPSSPVLDAALIAAAQKVEHYEITAYGTARAMAELLGHTQTAAVLARTLKEEKETDAALTEIAEAVIGGEVLEMAEEEAVS